MTDTSAPTGRDGRFETIVPAAEDLDAGDPLACWRDRFVVDDPDLAYLDGNSLGRLPLATERRLRDLVARGWGGRLVRGWEEWLSMPAAVGDLLGTGVLGAGTGEVIVSDSTTVNLYKLASAALAARPGRHTILMARDEFPTDRYIAEGLARRDGFRVRWLDPDPVEGITTRDVEDALDPDVALLILSHVSYRTAAIADVPAIGSLVRDAGALTIWDLSHAAGAVPVELERWQADLAVGCTYKYLHGGPGAPAWLFVRRSLQDQLRSPIQGWFGQRDQFGMGPSYDPAPGIGGWLTGTPGILALACVEEGARLVIEAEMERIRAKSVALTEYAIGLFDRHLAAVGCALGSPRDPRRRGSHVAIRHPAARELCARMAAGGVVTDFREPDSIRLGLAPLTTRFVDVRRAVDLLRSLLDDGAGRETVGRHQP